MTDLLDVNVLVSLAWPNHVHHAAALGWFRRQRSEPWATTPMTEAGFVRVSSNAAAMGTPVSPGDAVAQLARMCRVGRHVFLADDVPLIVDAHVLLARIVSHRQVTDAHLLALARRNGARLVTLDRAIASLAGDGGEDVLVVPAS